VPAGKLKEEDILKKKKEDEPDVANRRSATPRQLAGLSTATTKGEKGNLPWERRKGRDPNATGGTDGWG